MHKKLAADLTSLAHSILQLKNKEDVFALKEKAYEVYEKLAVLAYVEEYINTTPNATETKEELVEKVEKNLSNSYTVTIKFENKRELIKSLNTQFNEIKKRYFVGRVMKTGIGHEKSKIINVTIEEDLGNEVIVFEESREIKDEQTEVESITEKVEKIVEEMELEVEVNDASEIEESVDLVEEKEVDEPVVEEIIEQPFDELEQTLFSSDDFEKEVEHESSDKKTVTLEEELEDTISVEVAADLFEKAEVKKSLNDQLQKNIQIGLNDRIAFVKNLFDGSQEDFNRVVSQLNSFKTEKEAKKFLNKMVKPDYDWSEKEEYETRLVEIVERRFA